MSESAREERAISWEGRREERERMRERCLETDSHQECMEEAGGGGWGVEEEVEEEGEGDGDLEWLRIKSMERFG